MGKLKDLFTNRIWSIDTDRVAKVSNGYARLVTLVKLIRITINTFNENRMGFQCVALSYFSALAIVPFAAFIFAVGGGLKMDDKLSELAASILPNNPEFFEAVERSFAHVVTVFANSAGKRNNVGSA